MMKFKLNTESIYDAFCLFLALPVAYFLRSGGDYLDNHSFFLIKLGCFFVAIVYGTMRLFKIHTKLWKYTSIQDVLTLAIAIFLGTTLWYVLASTWKPEGEIIPRSIPFILVMVSILFTCGARIFVRFMSDMQHHFAHRDQKLIPVYLVGSIDAIDKIIVSLKHPLYSSYLPIGIIDHHENNIGKFVRNIPVIGALNNLEVVLNSPTGKRAELALFADFSLQNKYTNDIFRTFTTAGIATIFLPNFGKLPSGDREIKTNLKIDYNSLLRRNNYIMNPQKNFALIHQRKVFITGAGGSIGSEIVRQICAFDPAEIILVDNSEYLLYLIDYEISHRFPHIKKISILADVRDQHRIHHLVHHHQPNIIFHAAAIKHVPMAEENPDYAFLVNVVGTKNVLEAADTHQVDLVIIISTDKAVNPTSIMGATKQLSEKLCLFMNKNRTSATKFLTVRFGNVIGSNGSVLPLFEKQIEEGGPVTVTHKDIVRFFMTIPEAVDLVLETASIGQNDHFNINNGIFVLNMGEPVKIRELAEQMIILKGERPYETIDIVYTGLRPGEKLYEELFDASEEVIETPHEWLKIAISKQILSYHEFNENLQEIEAAINANNKARIRQAIKNMTINFQESDHASVVC
ncbi:MAG TPA: nucleoside-diphosphate sugar epimerase/dehydratase [Candidatus Nitrosotenuis sp.]|jgi:O-antigen biosynthesis protein WbqV|nr:nucleoside-diphosphate sugar epimerase/dehydratase [Candidatus Nitrosotenuis sp.]